MATPEFERLTDDVYGRLRDMILSNMVRPGQKLVDRDLAELLGVSRTPVREALGRLAMMGLVVARVRRGYYVSDFSAKQVTDLYEFRKILEVHAATLAAQNAQPSHLEEFDQLLAESQKLISRPNSHAAAITLDLKIHELIARASGNTSLHLAMQNLLDKVMCFMWLDDVTISTDDLAAAHRQHQTLLRLIKQKDAERARVLIHSHIDGAQDRLEKVFQARDDLRSLVLASPSSNRKGQARKSSNIASEAK